MAKFVIGPHMRLQEWVAEEKGYFAEVGLDYEFRRQGRPQPKAKADVDHTSGAYQTFEEGRDAHVSCACHWTVNMAASNGHGQLWGDAYSVTPSGLFVPPDSPIKTAEDLADVPVTVGYQSGSHYSTIQGLERFLEPGQIKLHFGGLLFARLELLLNKEIPAGNAFGAPMYLLEQLGYRKILDTTFMIAAMVPEGVDKDDMVKYYEALKMAQQDIDLRHDLYTHYFLKEMPPQFHELADTRGWGPGERIVFEPYSQDIFEETHKWVVERDIFDPGAVKGGGYDQAVATAAAE